MTTAQPAKREAEAEAEAGATASPTPDAPPPKRGRGKGGRPVTPELALRLGVHAAARAQDVGAALSAYDAAIEAGEGWWWEEGGRWRF